jgi:uncharacterized protein YaaN involved in tellurite resistance
MVRARRVAEAAIDVQRARRARLELLRGWDWSTGEPKLANAVEPVPDFKPILKDLKDLAQRENSTEIMQDLKMAQTVAKQLDRVAKIFKKLQKVYPKAATMTWSDVLHQLERLDRYERRARSRCNRAIKEFDYMKTKAMSI